MLTAFAFSALMSLTSCAQQTNMPKHRVYCRLPLNSDAAKWIKHIKFMVLSGRRPSLELLCLKRCCVELPNMQFKLLYKTCFAKVFDLLRI